MDAIFARGCSHCQQLPTAVHFRSLYQSKSKSKLFFITVCSLNICKMYYRHSVKLLPHGPNTHYRHGSIAANMLKSQISICSMCVFGFQQLIRIILTNFPSILGFSSKRYDNCAKSDQMFPLLENSRFPRNIDIPWNNIPVPCIKDALFLHDGAHIVSSFPLSVPVPCI